MSLILIFSHDIILNPTHSVVAHLKSLGWEKELEKIEDPYKELESLSSVQKACTRNVTEDGKFFGRHTGGLWEFTFDWDTSQR